VKVERFEDLYAWQKARLLTLLIYRVTGDGKFARDTGLGRQIQRAAVSIMLNIAEGFERGNRAEFYHFLNIAKSSCAELRSQLYVALDVGHLGKEKFDELTNGISRGSGTHLGRSETRC
jgi:four helix bundle protein